MSPLFLAGIFVATVAVALLAFETGLRFGRWRRVRPDPEAEPPVRVLVSSILSLLAFILGFTFGLASSHWDSRRQLVINEAIAIGTAYRRADLLPDPERTTLQRLLREYIDLRLETVRPGKIERAIPRLGELQEQIWVQAVAAGKKDSATSASPLIQSLTEVIEVHGQRVLTLIRSRIPPKVWFVLYLIMVISVAAAGYLAGLSGTRRSIAAVAYALAFAAVIVMIAGGDAPGSEQFQASHQALIDLRARLNGP